VVPTLLEAVLARPDDDELRLVYADQLEERGDLVHATLIRTECALAGVPKYDARWMRHWIWKAANRAALELPALPEGMRWSPFATERGLPYRLAVLDVDAFLAEAGRLFANAPVTSLEIDARDPAFPLDRLVASPWLRRITTLRFTLGRFGKESIQLLEQSEHLGRVRELVFQFEGIADDGLHHLLQSPLVQQLSRLGLNDNFFLNHGGPIRRAFTDALPLPALRRLDLRRNRLDANVLRAVLESVAGLEVLGLANNPLGDNGYRLVAESTRLTQLATLDLAMTQPRLAGLRALAASPRPSALRFLALGHNRLGPTAARALAAAAPRPELRFLDLAGNKLGDAGVSAIIASPSFPRLERADLRDNDLGPETRALTARWFHEAPARSRALA
jgi:uncharacterized protein (TIGR02996 family)